MPASPPEDPYRNAMRLVAGIFLIAGSFTLSRAIEDTFLRAGGNRAFQAFYCATLAVPGTGLAVVASAIYPVNLSLAVALTALLFSVAGVAFLGLRKGGA